LEILRLDNDLRADSCPHCHGAFFARDALEPKVKVYKLKPTPLVCPKCGEALRQGDVWDGKLQLDECRACGGIWFDAGELARLRKLRRPDAREWAAAAAAIPTGPGTWTEIARRLRDWSILMVILAGVGPAHRAWVASYFTIERLVGEFLEEYERAVELRRAPAAQVAP
jgi:Zn-finger nucleic acid-binding protein